MKLIRGERLYYHLPYWGLSGQIPQIQVMSLTDVNAGTAGTWQDMEEDTDYVPPSSWSAPSSESTDPAWWVAILASPEATGNPEGTIVLTETSRIRTKVVAGDEIDIKPDSPDEWIQLVS